MASVVHETDGEIMFTGTVHQCELHIATMCLTDKSTHADVQAGLYTISMTEEEDAEYQRNPFAGFGSAS